MYKQGLWSSAFPKFSYSRSRQAGDRENHNTSPNFLLNKTKQLTLAFLHYMRVHYSSSSSLLSHISVSSRRKKGENSREGQAARSLKFHCVFSRLPFHAQIFLADSNSSSTATTLLPILHSPKYNHPVAQDN